MPRGSRSGHTRVEQLIPEECSGASVIDQPNPDVVVLRHRVYTEIVAGPGDTSGEHRRRIAIPTLPQRMGVYYATQPLGIGYFGVAKARLSERVPESLEVNLPGQVREVLTATSTLDVEPSKLDVQQAEALLIARHETQWYLTNERSEQVADPSKHAQRLADALTRTIEEWLEPLPNPDSLPAEFRRELFRRVGIPVNRDLGARFVEAVAGNSWAGKDLRDSLGRDLRGRNDGGIPVAPVVEPQVRGSLIPVGWCSTKFASRGFANWNSSTARRRTVPGRIRRVS